LPFSEGNSFFRTIFIEERKATMLPKKEKKVQKWGNYWEKTYFNLIGCFLDLLIG
jgi:hypothetical protein